MNALELIFFHKLLTETDLLKFNAINKTIRFLEYICIKVCISNLTIHGIL